MSFLDFIFPKYCVCCKKLGSYLCDRCFSYIKFSDSSICLFCQKPSIDFLTHPKCRGRYVIDGSFSALEYKGSVKKLIYTFKYKPYLSDLKNTLTDLFYDSLIQKEEFYKLLNNENLIIVPIPLYPSKMKKRGYNQAEILGEELIKRLDPSHSLRMTNENLLERVKNTESQFKLKKEERKENVKGVFRIKNKALKDLSDKSILLVDDVLTTGSTLLEAANVLKRNGAKKVFGITLARD